jgi:ABC-type phosphate transport system substrate-binding protein
MQILYSPVGSGAGKRALIAYDASSASTGLGVPSSGNNVPFVSSFQPTYGYPNLQFIGSDDIWNATDATNYAAGPAKDIGGNVIQMPALAGAVVVAFNGKDGAGNLLNIANAVPAGATADKTTYGYPGAYSGLNLTRKAVCGIFTGHITAWNDPELTKANNNTVLGTGQITVAHRSDGSGTNFLFTNALYRQCEGVSGPINTTDALSATPSVRSWEFRFSDHSAAACPDVFYRAANTIDWPDFSGTATNGCGVTLTPPAGSKFVPANGNGGMKTTIESTNGAIGYSTTDYSQPVLSTGMKVANVQSQYDVDNATGAFQWPSPQRILNTMAASNPIFPDANARANPLNWSSQGQVPNPGTPDSYPIAGFTWIDMYQCYNPSRSGGGTLTNLENYLGFHYYDTHAAQIINSAGPATDGRSLAARHRWRSVGPGLHEQVRRLIGPFEALSQARRAPGFAGCIFLSASDQLRLANRSGSRASTGQSRSMRATPNRRKSARVPPRLRRHDHARLVLLKREAGLPRVPLTRRGRSQPQLDRSDSFKPRPPALRSPRGTRRSAPDVRRSRRPGRARTAGGPSSCASRRPRRFRASVCSVATFGLDRRDPTGPDLI